MAMADEVAAPKTRLGLTFSTRRQTFLVCFFIFYCALDVALLGLVSQQLNKFGNTWTSYPNGIYYHALGLGLFACIFGLLYGIFHYALGYLICTFCMFAGSVFFGIVAGLLTATPFGHGLKCGNPVESFPLQYQPFVSQCSRITAIVGLAWALFGLSVIGFFFFIFDKYSLVSKREHVYEEWVDPNADANAREEMKLGH